MESYQIRNGHLKARRKNQPKFKFEDLAVGKSRVKIRIEDEVDRPINIQIKQSSPKYDKIEYNINNHKTSQIIGQNEEECFFNPTKDPRIQDQIKTRVSKTANG